VLLLSSFVKRYRSWSAFVAATVCFLTLGNLMAGALLCYLAPLPTQYIMGFTVYWDMTSIPAILIGVPVLVRATLPTIGRSKLLRYTPQWSSVGKGQMVVSLVFSLLFVALGGVVFLLAPGLVAGWQGLASYFAIAAALVVIFGPIANLVVGPRLQAKQPAA
jgi:type IV secretory pathway TrbL component